jgi:tetratricopeptide (TPR) repeat protein
VLEGWQDRIGVMMIVRNEEANIEKALRSTLPFASAWAICDTGSTDGTWHIVNNLATRVGVPTHLFRAEWVDFAHNRNLVLADARASFGRGHPAPLHWLSLDADETCEVTAAVPPRLEADVCLLPIRMPPHARSWVPRIVRAGASHVKFHFKAHEVLGSPGQPFTMERFGGIVLHHADKGPEADLASHRRNLGLLRAEYEANPTETRTWFYLGDAWEHLGDAQEAAKWYRKRATVDGNCEEEGWYALYRYGLLLCRGGKPEGVDILLRAAARRPWRAEPLAELATYYHAAGVPLMAAYFERWATAIPYPEGDLMPIEELLYRPELRPSEDEMAEAGHEL